MGACGGGRVLFGQFEKWLHRLTRLGECIGQVGRVIGLITIAFFICTVPVRANNRVGDIRSVVFFRLEPKAVFCDVVGRTGKSVPIMYNPTGKDAFRCPYASRVVLSDTECSVICAGEALMGPEQSSRPSFEMLENGIWIKRSYYHAVSRSLLSRRWQFVGDDSAHVMQIFGRRVANVGDDSLKFPAFFPSGAFDLTNLVIGRSNESAPGLPRVGYLFLHHTELALHGLSLASHDRQLVSSRLVGAPASCFHFPELQNGGKEQGACEEREPSRPSYKVSIKLIGGLVGLITAFGASVLGCWCLAFWNNCRGWWLLCTASFGAMLVLVFQCAPLVFR